MEQQGDSAHCTHLGAERTAWEGRVGAAGRYWARSTRGRKTWKHRELLGGTAGSRPSRGGWTRGGWRLEGLRRGVIWSH